MPGLRITVRFRGKQWSEEAKDFLRELVRKARKVLSEYDIEFLRIYFGHSRSECGGGLAHSHRKIGVRVGQGMSYRELLFLLFHEAGHAIDKDWGKGRETRANEIAHYCLRRFAQLYPEIPLDEEIPSYVTRYIRPKSPLKERCLRRASELGYRIEDNGDGEYEVFAPEGYIWGDTHSGWREVWRVLNEPLEKCSCDDCREHWERTEMDFTGLSLILGG
ncbi:MAG: hypothetical protein QXG14_02460 [Candidatus Hadarchaeales archaeon]